MDTYGLDPAKPARKPAPPTQPKPFMTDATGDTMLDAAIHRRRSSLEIQREVRDESTRAYIVPSIMFAAGVTIVCGLNAHHGLESVAAYLLGFAISVPIGVGVYFLFCLLWIGFDAPLHLIALRLAGIYAVTDATGVLLAFVPGAGPILAIVGPLVVYFLLLIHMLEVEMIEAFVIGFATWFIKFIVVILIMALL